MSKRIAVAIEILKAGGRFRHGLERQFKGGEKFEYRLFDAAGARVKGFGFATFKDLESSLVRDWSVFYGSACRSEYTYRPSGGPKESAKAAVEQL